MIDVPIVPTANKCNIFEMVKTYTKITFSKFGSELFQF